MFLCDLFWIARSDIVKVTAVAINLPISLCITSHWMARCKKCSVQIIVSNSETYEHYVTLLIKTVMQLTCSSMRTRIGKQPKNP